MELIPAGNSSQHQNFLQSTFPVAHVDPERDLVTKAKGSVGVGQRRVWSDLVMGGVAERVLRPRKIAGRSWKVCSPVFSIDISV